MVKEIYITFWKWKKDSEEVFSFSTSVNPNYVKGQKIFLEFTCHPLVPEKFKKDDIKMTKFKIVDIHQSVRQTLSNQPTIEKVEDNTYTIPFSFHTHISMEVYVKEINYPWNRYFKYRLKNYVNKLKK